MKLEGRVAIVTGGAQGIGAAIASEFASEGATVAAIDRKREIEETCRAITEKGGKARAFHFDVTDYRAYQECVEEVSTREGKIDLMVNNAAIASVGDIFQDSLEQWRKIQAVNLEPIYWGCKLVAPYMAKQEWGRIINISSVEGFATEGGAGAYVAAKGAVISYTRSLAVELAPYGILVNSIAPGYVHTPMSITQGVDETETDLFETWYIGKRKIPLARPAQPKEIARVAVFLASEDCSYITGQTLVVDGGMTATF